MGGPWLKKHLTGPAITALGKRKERRSFSKAPILIGGCARSGTTLLLAILSAHPRLFCFPKETDAFTEWTHHKGRLIPIRPDRMYRQLLLTKVPETAHRWCEKRPYNVLHIPEILAYFGSEARFIHLVRDPRAVCTSTHPENPAEYWVSPERYVRDVSEGLRHQNHPQVLTIRFEDLILHFDPTIRRVCEFIGEEVCPEIIAWHAHAKVRSNRAWFTGLQDLQSEAIERWKVAVHKQRVDQVMSYGGVRELMLKLGYGGVYDS